MRNFFIYLALSIGFCFCNPNVVLSDIVLGFSDGTTTGSNFNITAGSTVTFFVFVTETAPNNELSAAGLIGFGVRADYSATSGAGGLVTANSVDPGFDSTFDNSFTATELNLAGNILANSAPQGTTIALGQFDLTTTAVGVTNFVFGDYDPGQSDFVTTTVVDLDPTIFAANRTFGLTINAVAVPEPSGSILALISGAILARRRRSTKIART